ncbi:hypothetical protein LZC95_46345 [Pendulispora brunnea]|uniref:NfeD-like C-terminal domain-containing protein n=1 Tax=Pendulispora brunnea TaxID=2905690 RepID=A0ABZ2KAH5_9BACT
MDTLKVVYGIEAVAFFVGLVFYFAGDHFWPMLRPWIAVLIGLAVGVVLAVSVAIVCLAFGTAPRQLIGLGLGALLCGGTFAMGVTYFANGAAYPGYEQPCRVVVVARGRVGSKFLVEAPETLAGLTGYAPGSIDKGQHATVVLRRGRLGIYIYVTMRVDK